MTSALRQLPPTPQPQMLFRFELRQRQKIREMVEMVLAGEPHQVPDRLGNQGCSLFRAAFARWLARMLALSFRRRCRFSLA